LEVRHTETVSAVAVTHDVFCSILNDVAVDDKLDTGMLLVTSGSHDDLGQITLIDSPFGGRVVVVSRSKVDKVASLKAQ
jgi:hypothetical protein